MEKKNEVHYYPNANWASIKGNFTPEQLIEIAEKIKEDHKEFKKTQEN